MKARIEYTRLGPQAMQSLLALQGVIDNCGLDEKLLHLVKLRASQMNGCAHCIDMHSKDARAAGDTEQRLYGLNAWHETPYYTERERAALEWTEAVTLVASTHVPDPVYLAVRAQFSEGEIANLTLAVSMINAWNRLAISLRAVPGNYKPGMYRVARQAASGAGVAP